MRSRSCAGRWQPEEAAATPVYHPPAAEHEAAAAVRPRRPSLRRSRDEPIGHTGPTRAGRTGQHDAAMLRRRAIPFAIPAQPRRPAGRKPRRNPPRAPEPVGPAPEKPSAPAALSPQPAQKSELVIQTKPDETDCRTTSPAGDARRSRRREETGAEGARVRSRPNQARGRTRTAACRSIRSRRTARSSSIGPSPSWRW